MKLTLLSVVIATVAFFPGGDALDKLTIQSCTSTSPYSAAYACQYTYEGSERTDMQAEWAVRGGGTGIWIKYAFGKTVTVKQVRILQRCHKDDQTKKMKLSFTDGSSQEVGPLACGTGTEHYDCDDVHWAEIDMKSVDTSFVKIELTENCGQLNNGLREVEFIGREVPLAKVTPAACTSTTPYSAAYACQYTYEGSERTDMQAEWAVRGGGTGIWIKYTFTGSVNVQEIRILQRCHKNDQSKQLKLSFSDGTTQTIGPLSCGTGTEHYDCDDVHWETFDLKTTRTNFLKIEVVEICGQLNNGLREVAVLGY